MIDATLLLLTIGYLTAIFMAWNIGANDASNPTNTAVGAGALTIKQALILFSVFAGVGALLQGWMVMKTFGKGVVPDIDIIGALSAAAAAGTWVIIASWKGIPVSTSQSMAGGVLGVGLAYVYLGRMGINEIRWNVVYKILLSWVTSPFLSLLLAITLFNIFIIAFSRLEKKGYNVNHILKILIITSLVFSAYSFGANDVGNATGVYYAVTSKYLGLPDINTRIFLALLGSIGIALGGFTFGKRVIVTVGYRITRLDLVTGAAAGYANALTVWLFTTIPYQLFGYGMPISTTHASVTAVIGVGIAKSKSLSSINWQIVLVILASWLFTLPITIGLGFIYYMLINGFLNI
ncbi:MAG: inorganic phosphate transporter [Staphylothermus sp.]|nr:inorganic phosphate transporter [Staphylothermus sp.]